MVVEDVTDEIRLKDEIFAKEKNSLLNQMIAEISHDILNPLTAIKTLTELMPKKKGNEDFYQKLSSIVPKEVDRITALIKRLLDYAKPYQSKREMVDLPEAIQACIHLMAPVMEREGIGFQLKTEKGSRLYTDEGQLKQSMLNLIANGIDAMKERKKKEKDLTPLHADFADSYVLSVTEWKENGMIYIQVKDQGIGMSHSQQEKAVTPFFTTKSTGSGLGLSITKRFVEENGGKLKIESYQGKGTTITLCFIDAMSLSVETSYADRGQMMNDGRRRT